MSDFLTLRTALTGLLAARTGVETTSHNVANAGSRGYTRQRVDQTSRAPGYQSIYGTIGTGTQVEGISRARDTFLDLRARSAAEALAGSSTRARLLEQSEAALAEPELGVSAALTATWSAWEDLALDPTNTAARLNVLSNLETLAGRVRGVAEGWQRLAADVTTDLATAVSEANRLLERVAELNEAVQRAPQGAGPPNDLIDQRDLALDRLSELLGTDAVTFPDGTVRVTLDGVELVHGGSAHPLEQTGSNLIHQSGAPATPGGSVGALQRFLVVDLPSYQADIDAFSADLATAFNDRHAAGWWSASDPGGPLFSFNPAEPALTLQVALTQPERLATAADPGPPFPVHDGRNAEWVAALRTDPVTGGGTLAEAWRELVTRVGVATAATRAEAESRRGLSVAANLARESAHGVSIDEEMVNLIQYQHAYEASARVMTAVDELLEVLVNRTGLVGR